MQALQWNLIKKNKTSETVTFKGRACHMFKEYLEKPNQ